ncbi:MAG: hypothetical protein D8M61_11670 [Ignavibacteriae bacterium]|nr:hypothetical protein [Ignavibacteriota bacterium]
MFVENLIKNNIEPQSGSTKNSHKAALIIFSIIIQPLPGCCSLQLILFHKYHLWLFIFDYFATL